MNDLNLNVFLKVFYEKWCDFVANGAIPLGAQDIDSMNAIMFGDGGVISQVFEQFNNEIPTKCVSNCYEIDAILTSDKNSIIAGAEYPIEVKAIIKQVKDYNVIQPAWDLIHWRSPLKILVLYDWVNFDEDCAKDINCVNTTLSKICSLLDDVECFNVESDITEYLFLLLHEGGDTNEPPEWYWSSNHQRKLRNVTGDGALDRAKIIAKEVGKCSANLPQKFEYSFELHQPYEDAISLHGALHRKINRVLDSINEQCKQEGLSVDNSCISISSIEQQGRSSE